MQSSFYTAEPLGRMPLLMKSTGAGFVHMRKAAAAREARRARW
jgi:hypothetical protein